MRTVTGILCALWASGLVAAEPPNQRYVLFQGTHEVSVVSAEGGSLVKTEAVFKIDTVTGDTWVLIEALDSTKRVRQRRWVKISD